MLKIPIEIEESNSIDVVLNVLSDRFLISIPYLNWSHEFINSSNNGNYWLEQLRGILTQEQACKVSSKLQEIDLDELLIKPNFSIYRVEDIKRKLNEARFFLNKIQSVVSKKNNDQYLNYYLSAFVTPARSVLQYTHESAKQKKKLSDYNKLVSGNKILKYFKSERDLNIHFQPIEHNKSVTTDLQESITVNPQESINVQVFKDDSMIYEETVDNHQENRGISEVNTNTMTTVKYVFTDWKGDEDLIELSYKYVELLDKFINEAISLGIIE